MTCSRPGTTCFRLAIECRNGEPFVAYKIIMTNYMQFRISHEKAFTTDKVIIADPRLTRNVTQETLKRLTRHPRTRLLIEGREEDAKAVDHCKHHIKHPQFKFVFLYKFLKS